MRLRLSPRRVYGLRNLDKKRGGADQAVVSGLSAGRPAAAGYALPSTKKKLKAVGKRETYIRRVRGIHFNLIQQFAHATRFLGTEQMALAGMPAHDLARGSDFKALGGTAMRL